MFDEYLKTPPSFDDMEAGFDAAGVDMAAGQETPELSMEEMLYQHFLDQLIEEKQNSLNYQDKIKQQNTAALQEADRLRRKLGG